MIEIEGLLGIKPVIGGRHPNYGTHHAPLSLGESTYLEIIASDPASPAPGRGRILWEGYEHKPGLPTWVLRSEHIEVMHAKAVQNGLTFVEIESGKREKPGAS